MFKISVKKRDDVLTTSENPVTHLQHTKGKNADYKITIIKEPTRFEDNYYVYAIFGKIGTGLIKANKIGSFNNFDAAKKLYNKKLKEKLTKGYEIISNKL